jgi:hypothetical protein
MNTVDGQNRTSIYHQLVVIQVFKLIRHPQSFEEIGFWLVN